MIVSELITRLQTCNQNDEVEFSDVDGEIPIDDIEEEGGFVFLVSGEVEEEDEINEEDEEK